VVKHSRLLKYLEAIHRRYPTVWSLTTVPRASWMLLKIIRPGMRILEVGAADRRMERRIRAVSPDIVYKSMDIDRGLTHDYYSLDDVHEQFDLIVLFEIIEHLDLSDAVKMLTRLRELMSDGGRVIISTPNIYHPHRYWQKATHKTPFSYSELAGIMMERGYEIVTIHRAYKAPFITYCARMSFFYPFHRILDVDFAESIIIVAQKGTGPVTVL
jgi:SAM-dependent methyltransferase